MPLKKTETKERSPLYYLVFIPGAVLLTIVAGWSVFWFFVSRQTGSAVTNWMAQEAKLGRNWSCPDQKIGGYPFTVVVSCSNLLFQGEILGKPSTGTVRGFQATAPLLRNDNLLAKIDPPFTAKTSDGLFDISIRWDEFYVELEGPPTAYERVALAGTKVRVDGKAGPMDPVEAVLDQFNSTVTRSSDRHDNAYDFKLSVNNGSIPALNGFLGSQQPIEMELGGTISQAKAGGAETLADFLEKWRLAKGHLDITTARLASGDTYFDAKGGLALDEDHRAEGKFDASFAGFENAFRQLNVDPGVIAAGQLLSGFLGKRGGTPGRLNLPVTFSGGFVSIGPVHTSIQIPPLY